MGRLPLWLTLLLCSSLGSAAVARAQQAEPEAADAPNDVPEGASEEQIKERARVLFNEGLDFVEQEDWEHAEDRFRRVLLLRSSHVVAYNLASALSHLGRMIEASELLRTIIRDPAADARTQNAAEQLLAETEPRIGIVTLRVSGDATGTQMLLDDKPLEVGAQIATVSVDPGTHRARVERDGVVLASRTVEVGGDAELQVAVTLQVPPRLGPVAGGSGAARPSAGSSRAAPGTPSYASAGAFETDTPERDRGGDSVWSKWWLWTAVGATVVGAAVAGVLLARRSPADPVRGDTDPRLVHGVVVVDMP